MNRAVFINSIKPEVKKQIEKIVTAQEGISSLQNKLELEVGVLKIDKEGADVMVDLEYYDSIAGEIKKNLDEIRKAYECLLSMGVFKAGEAAKPPNHPILPKYQQLP